MEDREALSPRWRGMSKERARARAAREAARAEERDRLVRAREEQARRQQRAARLRPSLRPLRRPLLTGRRTRQRRFGALPTRDRLALLAGWLGFQLLAWQVFPEPRTRLGLALVSLAALPLVVVLTRNPSRRRT